MKPTIGITFSHNVNNDPDNNYIRAIEKFGGEPLTLYPGASYSLDDIDGLLLTGGGDIHPDNFGATLHPSLKYVSEARDALEIPLCRDALAADKPILGICRGIQIMGVAMNGSLYQDIPTEYRGDTLQHQITDERDKDAWHPIEIEPNSRLSDIIGWRTDEVNSSHHQALEWIGTGFKVTARAPDGIIEAMEAPSKTFVVGVQYHPERMPKDGELSPHSRKLFEAFIEAAARH